MTLSKSVVFAHVEGGGRVHEPRNTCSLSNLEKSKEKKKDFFFKASRKEHKLLRFDLRYVLDF